MAITNEKRREVAERLRKCIRFAKECDQNNEGEMIRENGNVMFRDIAEAVGGDYANFIDSYEETLTKLADLLTKLADLIEPEPERTCRVELIDTGNEAAYEHYEYIAHCHSCHHEFGYVLYNEDGDTWQDELPNFCPNCGARVKE